MLTSNPIAVTDSEALSFEQGMRGHPTVAVLIPAYNEAEQIQDTIRSLRSQTRVPDRILVIANNCTDNTAELAKLAGAEVLEMDYNPHKKAGALNAGIAYLRQGRFPDFLVTIDGDTELERHFIQRSLSVMRSRPEIGGLSAVCYGKTGLGSGLLSHILTLWQRAEYSRASWLRIRRNVHTLSGAGSVLRSAAVLDVLGERGVLYKESADNLVEDFEATLAMKKHGWVCTNNHTIIAYTDLMVTVRSLYKQRIRWVGGTVDELRRYGWRKETRFSIITMVFGTLTIPIYYLWFYFLWMDITYGISWFDMFYIACMCLWAGIALYSLGKRAFLLGLLLVLEVPYNIIRHTWIGLSLCKSFFGRARDWE